MSLEKRRLINQGLIKGVPSSSVVVVGETIGEKIAENKIEEAC